MKLQTWLDLFFVSQFSLQAAMARFVAEVEEAIIVLCKELEPVKSVVTPIFRG